MLRQIAIVDGVIVESDHFYSTPRGVVECEAEVNRMLNELARYGLRLVSVRIEPETPPPPAPRVTATDVRRISVELENAEADRLFTPELRAAIRACGQHWIDRQNERAIRRLIHGGPEAPKADPDYGTGHVPQP